MSNDQTAANQDRKRSNAAGPHEDSRTRRNRDRGSQRRRAVEEGKENA